MREMEEDGIDLTHKTKKFQDTIASREQELQMTIEENE